MVSLGAVVVEPGLERRFRAFLRPISENFVPEALAVGGYSRGQTLGFAEPAVAMRDFAEWVKTHGGTRPVFISDNNGFDWMFVAWYFHHFLGANPFGHSSANLGSLYKGLVKDCRKNFKHLRCTVHNHDPLDDAVGNAEAMLHLRDKMGLEWTDD
jgi:hypothetical protein